MKTLKNILFFFILTIATVSCGGEDDPTPVNPSKTDLEIVQESLVGTVWHFKKAEVTDGTESVQTINNGCIDGKYDLSVDDFTITFTSNTNVQYNSNCGSFDFTYKWSLTQDVDKFVLVVKGATSSTEFIHASVLVEDMLTENKLTHNFKAKFNEISATNNWLYSPTIYVEQ